MSYQVSVGSWSARRGLERRGWAWPLSLISLTSYVLANAGGSLVMASFLGVWLLCALARPAQTLALVTKSWLPWALPALALSSILWSDSADTSMRLGVELAATTVVATMMARSQPPGRFISAFMCAFLIGVVASALSGNTAAIGVSGEYAVIGLFGSKNNFALTVCLMMFGAAAVLFDGGQPRLMRLLGFCGLLIGPAYLWLAKSVGAFVVFGPSFGVLIAFTLFGQVPPKHRGQFIGASLLVVLCLIIAGALLLTGDSAAQALSSVGKDASLTGRTYLWSRAATLISMRPVLGVGYQAFWVQGFTEAEGLWRWAQIDTRGGFHFHNLFFETGIELGYLGVLVLGGMILSTFLATLWWSFKKPTAHRAFFLAIMIFLMMRMYVEVDFIGPFAIGSLLLPVAWNYASPFGRDRS